MNASHLQFCASPEWRQLVEATILPEALAGIDLGPDVLEIGPGPGLTTDVLRRLADHLTCVEFDAGVPSAGQQDRVFAELVRVLRPGGRLVAADGVYSEETARFHEGDVYNPVDPDELEGRLSAAGFGSVEVRSYDMGWVATALAA